MREASYRMAGFWVIRDNARARAFYEHRGWTLVDGEVLEAPSGVVEVRYQRGLP